MKWPKSLLSPVLAFLTACAAPGVGMADTQPPPKTPTTQAATADTTKTDKPPMVVTNADGTITVQKSAPKDDPNAAKAKKGGLVIPPQVVAPITPPAPDHK